MIRSLLFILPVAFALTLVCCREHPEVDIPDTGTENPVVSVEGVSLDRETLQLSVGGSATLAAGIAPQYATNKNVSWSSADTAVATVDLLTGKVTAVGAGVTAVTATTLDGGHKAVCEVTVEAVSDGDDDGGGLDDSDDSEKPNDGDDEDGNSDNDPKNPSGGDDDSGGGDGDDGGGNEDDGGGGRSDDPDGQKDPPDDSDDDDEEDDSDNDPKDPSGGDDDNGGGEEDDDDGGNEDDGGGDPEPPKTSGMAGVLTWALADDGTLTIDGSGAIPDYSSSDPAPWDTLRGSIVELVINSGVTSIGTYAFAGCENLVKVTAKGNVPPVLGIGNFTAYFDTLYVPLDCVGAYMDDPGWGTAFFTISEMR